MRFVDRAHLVRFDRAQTVNRAANNVHDAAQGIRATGNPDPASYIAKALSPARVTGVYLNEHAKGVKTATVVVPENESYNFV